MPDLLGAVLRIALGLVFLVAGGSKVAAGPAWPAQARSLGVPAPVARTVPWGELGLGALVAAGVARPWPAAVALAALVAFTALLAWHLAHGRRPACACFGAWSAAPIGAGHLARNAAFVALAVAVLAAG